MKQNHTNGARSLTALYCLHQAIYFLAIAGVGAFAVPYLIDKGFAASQVGLMLASTNILSFVLQPTIGSYVDRRSLSLLPKLILSCLCIAFCSFSAIELLRPALAVTGLLYIIGSLTFTITIPLSNSLCAYYTQNRYHIDYGMGSGIGSLTFSFASLGVGYIMADWGASYMMIAALICIAGLIVLVRRYPKVSEEARRSAASATADSLSIVGFCRRYRIFMLTMLGVTCLASCHVMAENYLLQIFERVGGGSEHVGTALFLACITAAPFLFFFERIQRRTGVVILMRLSGFFYVLKAALLLWAPSIEAIYVIGLMQTCTYAFLYPSLYYLVLRRVDVADMAKGQSLACAMYTLGTALGNSLGGAVLDYAGIGAMLICAVVLSAVGTALVNINVGRTDARA